MFSQVSNSLCLLVAELNEEGGALTRVFGAHILWHMIQTHMKTHEPFQYDHIQYEDFCIILSIV